MKAEKRKKILIYIGLTFLAVLMIIPFYWMLQFRGEKKFTEWM